jgi:hypothetical protein
MSESHPPDRGSIMSTPQRDVGHDEATEALAQVETGRSKIAERLITPVWYHPVLGLLVGGLIASAEWHSLAVAGSAFLVYAVGIGVLVSSYRRLTGIWVSGFRRGPAGRVSVLLAGVLYVIAGIAAILDFGLGLRGAFVAAGAIAVVAVVVLGGRFDEALRAELRGAE